MDRAAALKKLDIDAAVLFPNSFDSALLPFLARIPRRFGFNKDIRGLLLTGPLPVPEWKKHRHEVYYYTELVRRAGRSLGARIDDHEPAEPELFISEDRRQRAHELLAAANADPRRPVVVLGPGSANSRAKRWPAGRFAALADVISAELGAEVVVLGSKDDVSIAADVVRMARSVPIDLTGQTDIAEAAAILAEADLLISNDMGLAHLAPAVGTRTVVMFGPTDPATTRPYSRKAVVVSKNVSCSPCMLRDCPIDHRCMTQLSVRDVLEASRSLIRSEAAV
jgi:heptosyltransferase II